MRPQHITAENARDGENHHGYIGASMRPQHITAENYVHVAGVVSAAEGFNEAAAYHCGKRRVRAEATRRAALLQ